MSVVKAGGEEDFSIKPQATTPALDTSNWPLLLKNYDKRTEPRSLWSLLHASGKNEDVRLTWVFFACF
jgi:hypothetical protein